MALQLQYVLLLGFAGLMVAAAFEDLRRLIIPNILTLALCLLWPLYIAMTAPSLYGTLGALGCAVAVFLAGAVCFSRGYLGGGDVKLLAVATLWAGPAGTPALLLLTGILGGLLAVFLMMPPGAYIADMARVKLGPPNAPVVGQGLATPIPYGIAIACAAIVVTLLPHFR
jgi:prepilin peptidase CpaA